MPRTAFVTGATGFLGLNLVEQLCAQEWQVFALTRATSSLSFLRRFPVERVTGDVLDGQSVYDALPPDVDAVFHTAADTSQWRPRQQRQWRINVEGTHRVLEAAQRRRAKCVVFTSCWGVFGLENDALHEDLPQAGKFSIRNIDRTKVEAEEAVRRAGHDRMQVRIMNPCHMVGPYDREGWCMAIRHSVRGNAPLVPPGGASFCHVAEVAKAHIAAVDRGRFGANYLLGGTDAKFLEAARIVAELTDRRPPRRSASKGSIRRAARLNVITAVLSRADPGLTPDAVPAILRFPRIASTRAEEELGYEPKPLRTMLEDAYAWLEQEGLLK